MILNFAILCDNAFTDPQGRLNIIQTFSTVQSKKFPSVHPRFTIVMNYSPKNQNKEKNKNTVILQDPEKKTLASTTTTLEGEKDKKERQFISQFVGVAFKKPGKYKIIIKLDGERKRIIPFEVVKIQ